MNSLLYYYNNVQKMAAYRQAKRMQRGVKLGYNQSPASSSALKFTSNPIHIGTNDFSIEFWGNTYGASGAFYNPTLFFNNGGTDTFSIGVNSIGTNGVQWVHFGRDAAGGTGQDILGPNYIAPTQEGMFHCVVTRSGTLVKCFIEGEQKAQKTQTLLHDYGDVPIGIANSSNMGFVRVWNYALSADEIATLYNNGDPMGYVVPKAKRDSLLAEYLPQNLMYGRDDKTIATSWLDSAKQMPLSDEYMEPLFQSIGGYDMAANGAPEILYNSPKLDSKGVYFVSNGEDKNVHVVDLQLPNKNSFAIQLYAYNIEKYEHSSIVQIMLGSINYNIVFAIQDDTVVLYVGSESSIIDTPAQDIFNKDIVFNVNDTYIDVYVNNEKCDTLALKSPISLDVDNFFYALGEYIQVSMVRIFSEALTPDDIETLHNNGKPDAYVLPLSMKEGDSRCILEWLPKNIIPDQNNTSVASEWLDTATVPPPSDNAQPKITESAGGYDGMFQGNVKIVY